MKIVYIDGMKCNHCKMRIEKALSLINGVEKVQVNLEDKNAIVECSGNIDENVIREVIEEAGFEVKEIK